MKEINNIYLNIYQQNKFLKDEIEFLRNEFNKEKNTNNQLQEFLNVLILEN